MPRSRRRALGEDDYFEDDDDEDNVPTASKSQSLPSAEPPAKTAKTSVAATGDSYDPFAEENDQPAAAKPSGLVSLDVFLASGLSVVNVFATHPF